MGSKPPIWRRIRVPGSVKLRKLHQILQVVMGWSNYHLHEFIIGESHFGEPDPDYGFEMKSDRTATLSQVILHARSKFVYIYDFGDGWEHEILIEAILASRAGMRCPVCLAGKRACPPEDCGGIWGYADFLKAIGDPNHEEHDNMLDWIGGGFDPEAFDLEEINQELKRMR